MKYQVINNFLDEDTADKLSKYINSVSGDHWQQYTSMGKCDIPYYFNNSLDDSQQKRDIQDELTKSLVEGHFTYKLKRMKKCVDTYCKCPRCSLRNSVLMDDDFLYFMSELAGIPNLKLVEDFASAYEQGDFLSIHPDPNFDVAFILNLTKNWRYEYGGCLTIFDGDNPTVILPEYNSLVLMYLGDEGIDHYISEVSSRAPHARIAVSGWFGASRNSS